MNIELCLAVPQPGSVESCGARACPETGSWPERGIYLFFYSITDTVLFVLHHVHCPVCISGLVFAPFVG